MAPQPPVRRFTRYPGKLPQLSTRTPSPNAFRLLWNFGLNIQARHWQVLAPEGFAKCDTKLQKATPRIFGVLTALGFSVR